MQRPVPASYGPASYHAEHAFLFTAADGMSQFGRYDWMPEAGEAYLASVSARARYLCVIFSICYMQSGMVSDVG
jgi:catalase